MTAYTKPGARPHVLDFSRNPNLSASIAWASTQPGGEGFTELLRATAAGRIALIAIMHRKAKWSPHDLKSRQATDGHQALLGFDLPHGRPVRRG